MTILVDECRWPYRGRLWCHCVSDADLGELHRFARRLGVPRRGFQGDHYDLPEPLRAEAVALGATPVPSRELLARLKGAGLRLSPAQRRSRGWSQPELRLEPAEWIGAAVHVVVDRPLGARHPLSGLSYPVNVGFVPDTVALDGEPVDAYVLGPLVAVAEARGTVVAVVRRHDDVEDKLVVAASGVWDARSVASAVAFNEQWFTTDVLVSRPGG
jgi:hypothetical protein